MAGMSKKEIIEQIEIFYSDTGRTRAQTKAGLEAMQSTIEVYLDSLQDADETVDDNDGEDDGD
jgi:hypothetical protein